MSSILTNNGAMVALQSLQMTQKALQDTQNRISTGMKVSSAKDNAATWAVATSMRADIANYKQVSENLSVSSGVVGTAAAGTEQITSLLSSIRTAVTSVQDGVKDAKTVQASINASLGQIRSIVDSSTFKGVNLLNGSTTGDTRILASVNSDGGVQTPTYVTVAQTNLTMETGGSLKVLDGFSVAGVVDKFAYSAPASTSRMESGDSVKFSFTLNGSAKTAEYVNSTGATLDMSNVEDVNTFMQGMRDAINSTAGSANQIASLDTQGRLVVDNTRATDTVAFTGATALSVGIDSGTAITLGDETNLAPAEQKFVYTKPTGAPTATTVYDFSFKVNGTAVAGSYTVPASTASFDTVMTGIKNAINAKAGTGNEIASLDAGGNLVVNASLGKDSIEFDGASALKTRGGSLSTTGTDEAQVYSYGATGVLTAAAVTGDTITLALNVNGEEKNISVTVDTLASTAGGGAAITDYAASGAGAQALIEDLATYVNTLGYGNVASAVGTLGATALTIDSSQGNLGLQVKSGVTTAGITATGTVAFTTAVTASTAADITAADRDQTGRFTYGGNLVAGDVLKFEFTQNGATKTAQTTVGATQTKAEVLRSLAEAINTEAGAVLAAVDGDIGSETIFVDGRRAASTSQISFDTTYTNVLTAVTHNSTNPMTATDETPAVDTSYEGLLATLKTAESAVLSAGAAFGAAQVRVDSQKTFIDKLSDTLTAGVGSLVDADMSAEAARLQALQVQQQLGTQALSIANQAPQSILSLFK